MFKKSCKKAYVLPVKGEIQGTIPEWIKGSLYRIGPAKFEVGIDKYEHVFDGLAMIQRYSIKDGKVSFNSQFIHSNTYLQNMAANRIVVSEFGTVAFPASRSIFNRISLALQWEFTDNTLVTVYPIGDELFTATECSVIHRIDQEQLSTIGSVRLNNVLPIHRALAHQHIDSTDGTVHLMGFVDYPVASYTMVTLPPIKRNMSSTMTEKYDMEKLLGNAKVVGKIGIHKKRNPSYFHSFGITENYYILFECPLTLSVTKLMLNKFTASPFSNSFNWDQSEKTIIHIMNKKTGQLLPNNYVADALFVFHHINAYEEKDYIVIDYCGYNDGSIITRLDRNNLDNKQNFPISTARRIVVPLNINKDSKDENLILLEDITYKAQIVEKTMDKCTIYCSQETLTKIPMEFPVINYNFYNGRKYRYFYGSVKNKIIKFDLKSKEKLLWTSGREDSFADEAIFIPDPSADSNNADDEDLGLLLCPVIYDETTDCERFQTLFVIDAKSMKEIGRAVFRSVSIPSTFHGIFINSS